MVTATQEHETREMVALNGDIVGYSRLMADDFEATSNAVENHEALVREWVHQSTGTLVNFVGDNFMAVFDDAKDAIQAAIGITTAIEDFNADLPVGIRCASASVLTRVRFLQPRVSTSGTRSTSPPAFSR